MNSLPIELIDQISSSLDHDDLKRTLFVFRSLQPAAERYCGAFTQFTFENDDEDYGKFISIYSGRRLRYLRDVEVHTIFPSLLHSEIYPDKLPCRESRLELEEKNEMFTPQVKCVFEVIEKVENEADRKHHWLGRLQLTIRMLKRRVPNQSVLTVRTRHGPFTYYIVKSFQCWLQYVA
jgi:hypothetical protein